MSLPDTERTRSDAIDLVTDSVKKQSYVEDKDGKLIPVVDLDYNKIWWKSQLVNSNMFGRFALQLEKFESLAQDCFHHMSFKRAEILSKQILAIGAAYRYSIDAKSSETVRDKNNTSGTLLHMITRVKIEKQYNVKGAAKKSVWDGIVGRDTSEESQD